MLFFYPNVSDSLLIQLCYPHLRPVDACILLNFINFLIYSLILRVWFELFLYICPLYKNKAKRNYNYIFKHSNKKAICLIKEVNKIAKIGNHFLKNFETQLISILKGTSRINKSKIDEILVALIDKIMILVAVLHLWDKY